MVPFASGVIAHSPLCIPSFLAPLTTQLHEKEKKKVKYSECIHQPRECINTYDTVRMSMCAPFPPPSLFKGAVAELKG
jgi:hypothetical protein